MDETPPNISNNTGGIYVNSDTLVKEKIRLENGLSKQEINDLRTKCANIEVDKEEVEIKNEALARNLAWKISLKLDIVNLES